MEKQIHELISAAKAVLDYEKEHALYDNAEDGEVWMSTELKELFDTLGNAVYHAENVEAK